MPKDLIHFKITEMTAAKLADTPYADHLTAHQSGLLLGAVFHDGLFYGRSGPGRSLERLAHQLHGSNGQDTFTLIRLQTEHIAQLAEPGLAISLLVGMVTHIFADVVMHPMVWYLSGNYYADDAAQKSRVRQRHRALESLMDMIMCPEMLGRPTYRVRRLMHSLKPTLFAALPVKGIADMAALSATETRAGLQNAFGWYGRLQTLYSTAWLARSLFTLIPLLPSAVVELVTLFYAPQLLRQAGYFDQPFTYTHPMTGKAQTATLAGMMEEAASRASELCRTLQPALFDNAPLHLPDPGPSLDTAIPGVATHRMSHYADPPFPSLP
ncbi:zinc dependent phospholipase C family protein [Pseudodesulfovibrio sediminis]|uniref:Phospholipase C/D domain-containing protein n=1 Tax=Pseudodesulfovibrio sediminis TaxID=2810563 RepID=A0ABM7PB92_9BACT|nr:zinc dependent phospholipase C family protein [Pseudodesulfovibrio sediminis]BCS90305.1 hypothetical protein PSDVSF_35470 [Pseudodesulfovibrio sediminis]